MKMVYSHQNIAIVMNVRNLIELKGIRTTIRNEFSSSGAGELSAIDTWPELWVEETQYKRAKTIVDELLESNRGHPWQCENCNELNDASFEFCWKCQKDRTDQPAPRY